MTIHDHIYNFLRDGQYQIGLYTAMIDNLEDEGSVLYAQYFQGRLEIGVFMDILYEGSWPIEEGYNHLLVEHWTDKEILREIEYLRYYNHMNEMPFVSFTAHYPKIIADNGGGSPGSGNGISLTGQEGQFVSFNASGQPYAEDFNPWGGHLDDPIVDYFNRT